MIFAVIAWTTWLAASDPSPWVQGPDAAPSTDTAPPAVAPRQPGAQHETLVVPATPPEPVRPKWRDDDGRPVDLRASTRRTRRQLQTAPGLDLDDVLFDVPGLWLLPRQSTSVALQARGLPQSEIPLLVDGVPLFDGGGLVPLLEVMGVQSADELSFAHGARVDVNAPAAAGGVLAFGAADGTDQLDSGKVDGAFSVGGGGPDLEKGGVGRLSTGWRRARLQLDAAILHHEDQRRGRGDPTRTADAGAAVLPGTSGGGGTAGVRAEVVPNRDTRIFAAWRAGRAVDVRDPQTCSDLDDNGFATDCLRTVERGVDVFLVGATLRQSWAGLQWQPDARVHAQRALSFDERAGSSLRVVQSLRDEGFRAGAHLGVGVALPPLALLNDVWRIRGGVAVDAFQDRFFSSMKGRSTRPRDAEPPGAGIEEPMSSRLLPGTSADTAFVTLTARAEGSQVSGWIAGRALYQSVRADAVPDRQPTALSTSWWTPSGEVGVRASLWDGASLATTLVHSARGGRVEDVAGVLAVADPKDAAFADTSAEVLLDVAHPVIRFTWTLWGAVRSGPLVGSARDPARVVRAPEVIAVGSEAGVTMATGIPGLRAHAALAGLAADSLSEKGDWLSQRTPLEAVIQPQTFLGVRYEPQKMPFGLFVRVRGGLPQARLSTTEQASRAFCPELPQNDTIAQDSACSGAPGFALLDAGAFYDVAFAGTGGLRVDLALLNVLDQEVRLVGSRLGSGGVGGFLLATVSF